MLNLLSQRQKESPKRSAANANTSATPMLMATIGKPLS
jgi:hypothetical protein